MSTSTVRFATVDKSTGVELSMRDASTATDIIELSASIGTVVRKTSVGELYIYTFFFNLIIVISTFYPNNNAAHITLTNAEIQTERPYIPPPKLFREKHVQTETVPEADGLAGPESSAENGVVVVEISSLESANGTAITRDSKSSTQMMSGHSSHAQPMSLDVSPIRGVASRENVQRPTNETKTTGEAPEKPRSTQPEVGLVETLSHIRSNM